MSKELPRCDYGIVATKAIHTRNAVAQVAHIFDDNSAVCSVQNGVGNEEIIAEHVKYVIRGTTFPAGHPISPGHIGYDIKGDTWIGPFEPTHTSDEQGRGTGRADDAFWHEHHRLERCAWSAVDEIDFQRLHQSSWRADIAASRRGYALCTHRTTFQRSDR